jgi:CHAT domain-containing protein
MLACLPILISGAAVASPLVSPVSPTTISREKASAIQAAEKAEKRASELVAADASYTEIIEAYQTSLELWMRTGEARNIQLMRIKLILSSGIRGDLRKVRKLAAEYLEATSNQKVASGWRMVALQQSIGVAQQQADLKPVIRYYKELIELSQDNRTVLDPQVQATILMGLASFYGDLGDFSAQRQAFADAKKVLQANHSKEDLTSAWFRLLGQEATTLMSRGEINKAVAIYEEAKTKLDLSPSQANLKEFDTIRLFAFSLQSYVCPQQAKTLQRIFGETQLPEKIQPAPRFPEQGYGLAPLIERYRKKGNWRTEALFLGFESVESNNRGDYKRALNLLEQQIALRRRMGDEPNEAVALANIAAIASDQGQPQAALQALQAALALQQKLGHRPAQLKTLLTFSDLYETLGAESLALGFAQQAQRLAEAMAMPGDQIDSLSRVAYLQKKLHRFPLATEALLKAMSVAERTGNCFQSSMLYRQMAVLQLEVGNLQAADNYLDKGSHYADGLQDEEIRIVSQAKYGNIKARILLKRGRVNEALQEAERALRLLQQTNLAFSNRTRFLATIAEAHVALGQIPQAIKVYKQQLDLLTTLNLAPERAQSLYAIAQLQRRSGDLAAALTSINQAIAVVEDIRKLVVDPELRTSFFASKQDFFSFKVDLLLELDGRQPHLGHAAEAFHTSERSRARTLLELLQEARADIRQGIEPALLAQEQSLRYRRTALDKRWKDAFSDQGDRSLLPQLQQERQQLQQQSQELRQAIRARSPRYAALTDPEPLTLQQVQQQLLDPDTLLLQFALGEKRSHLFVVSHNNLQVLSLPPAAQIDSLVSALREPLAKNQLPAEINSRAAALSQQILGPASQAIARHRRLIVVADGSLHLVPFAVLPQGDQPLLERHQLLQLPSSSTLALLQRQPSSRPASIAILADPIFSSDDSRVRVFAPAKPSSNAPPKPVDLRALSLSRAAATLSTNTLKPQPWAPLPGTRREAEAIQRLFPPQQALVALDEQANLHLAQDPKLARYSILHLATHGIFNTQEPAFSGLLLSLVDREGKPQDGFLQLADVFNLKLATDLVVLSACETGLAEQVKGEGLVGLTRGFLYAGSSRVLVSLWKVDDAATAKFMEYFYKALLQRRLPPSQALVAAQQQLRSNPRLASPYYWGAFVLQGEW